MNLNPFVPARMHYQSEPTQPVPSVYNIRGVKMNDQDLNELNRVVFGEVSNN
jgi:hypothetical protein